MSDLSSLLKDAVRCMTGCESQNRYNNAIEQFLYRNFQISTGTKQIDFNNLQQEINTKQKSFLKFFNGIDWSSDIIKPFPAEYNTIGRLCEYMRNWVTSLNFKLNILDICECPVTHFKGKLPAIKDELWYELTCANQTFTFEWKDIDSGLTYKSKIRPCIFSYNLGEISYVYQGFKFYEDENVTGYDVFINPIITGFINRTQFRYDILNHSNDDEHTDIDIKYNTDIHKILIDLLEATESRVLNKVEDLIKVTGAYGILGSTLYCSQCDGSIFIIYLNGTLSNKDVEFIKDFLHFYGYFVMSLDLT